MKNGFRLAFLRTLIGRVWLPVLLLLATTAATAMADSHFKTNDCNGLHISAIADKKTYGTNDRPLITVTFSNQSSKVIALLNHFAFTAEGPLFVLIIDNNGDLTQRMGFAEQLFFGDAHPHWILLKPGDIHRFQSRLSDVLPPGRHSLEVRYSVSYPAEKMIAECRKEPSCPSDFWHGDLLSNIVGIEVAVVCSTSNATPDASAYAITNGTRMTKPTMISTNPIAAVNEIRIGMTRDEVYKILGNSNGGVGQGTKESATEFWTDTPTKGQSLVVDFGADGRVHGINRERGKTHLVIVPGMKYSDVRTILAQCGAKEIPGSFAGLETAPHTYQLKDGTFLLIEVFELNDTVASLGRCEKEGNPKSASNWRIVDQVIP